MKRFVVLFLVLVVGCHDDGSVTAFVSPQRHHHVLDAAGPQYHQRRQEQVVAEGHRLYAKKTSNGNDDDVFNINKNKLFDLTMFKKTAVVVVMGMIILFPLFDVTSDRIAYAATTNDMESSTMTTTRTPSSQQQQQPPLRSTTTTRRYWDIMKEDTDDANNNKKDRKQQQKQQLLEQQERLQANEQLVEYAVGTANTMYYDASGGFLFQPPDFYHSWKEIRNVARKQKGRVVLSSNNKKEQQQVDLTTRQGAVATVKYVISQLHDPFSKYLTREELLQELSSDGNDGFLGLGAMVEVPTTSSTIHQRPVQPPTPNIKSSNNNNNNNRLSVTRAANLPIITAVAPDSPAERAGFTVGDRIVGVEASSFLGETRDSIRKTMDSKYHADNYAGYPSVTLAKPVLGTTTTTTTNTNNKATGTTTSSLVVAGYRTSHVHLPTMSLGRPYKPQDPAVRGDAIVHYEMLNKQDSIYLMSSSSSTNNNNNNKDNDDTTKVGYIRLTRFSRAATAGFIHALEELEHDGAQSYIVDLRNNYGGIIQEAMLTASSLLRDPHAVLCFTMNARGGFTPHDVEEYVVDSRYAGYLLSTREPKSATFAQAKREDPAYFVGMTTTTTNIGGSTIPIPTTFGKITTASASSSSWTPPSSFASLHEQTQKRGITVGGTTTTSSAALGQKPLVLLINEGTASSAEVFASALHDNHRLVALVGSPTYGKGLIQHTFPMPDGGGLRLTVAEYLTPALHHVRPWTPIVPDVRCGKVRGQELATNNIGADMCVGVALDVLNDNAADDKSDMI